MNKRKKQELSSGRWTASLGQREGGQQGPMSPQDSSCCGPLTFGSQASKYRGGGGREGGRYLDACAAALAHSIWHSCPGRVNHGHKPHETELLCGEVQLIRVELEAPRELPRWQVQLAEA